jgi:hypothetical protein
MSALRDALMEADQQTESRGVVWDTLRRIAEQLDRLKIPYAVLGGIAMQHYGIKRSTQDVDIVVGSISRLDEIHKKLIGHGYHLKSPGSRHLRDEITRVRIEFLVGGEFPGDGKPKSVSFPNPESVAEFSEDGIAFVNLKTLIELKLASAKSAAHRIKDRADVLELIHALGLNKEFGEKLDPYIRNEYLELVKLPPPSERD